MNQRGHVYYEIWIAIALFGVLAAIAVPALSRGSYLVGGLCALLAAALLGFVLRARFGRE